MTIIARGETFSSGCPYSDEMRLFETLLIILSGAEIVFKTIAMEIFRKLCGQAIYIIHLIVIVLFLLLNLTVYGWAVYLNLRLRKFGSCL
jgi:hypothetical protein